MFSQIYLKYMKSSYVKITMQKQIVIYINLNNLRIHIIFPFKKKYFPSHTLHEYLFENFKPPLKN